jgi:hypothetical protein
MLSSELAGSNPILVTAARSTVSSGQIRNTDKVAAGLAPFAQTPFAQSGTPTRYKTPLLSLEI